mgnify:CR=1 FL=1
MKKHRKCKKIIIAFVTVLFIAFVAVIGLHKTGIYRFDFLKDIYKKIDFQLSTNELNIPQDALSFSVYDIEQEEYLFYEGDSQLPTVASLAKLFAIDYALGKVDLEDIVEVNQEVLELVPAGSSLANLYAGEYTVKQIMEAMLVPSGNDAAYLALGGVGEKALLRFLSDRPNIKTVYLCLDNDNAGNDACSRLAELVPEGLTVHRLVPLYKDWNEVLQHRAEITDGKYLREAVYGLKEPPQEETVEIIRMSEVDTQTVEWLWEPYIPFGKVTIVQGNPGEGKTTFALRLAAACTTGGTLPGMKPLPPFQVIYQTAEDGLGDTVKPRLIEAEADLDRVLVIDEAKRELTLSDERIEKAITQNGARLIILDPIQAYMGEKTDMNRANEVRPMFRRLADVAERTGCAVILIGHLNKAAGGQSAYRGLGSIDFRAAARSVLLIGRVKREPNVRVIVHDKSSLAPEGKPVAFCLDPETGFSWIGEYDITADELLSGAGGNTATKTEQAERLILDLLADGKELASEDIVKAAAEAGISERTVQNAKRNMGGILGARRVGGQWYNFIKKKQPPEPAS